MCLLCYFRAVHARGPTRSKYCPRGRDTQKPPPSLVLALAPQPPFLVVRLRLLLFLPRLFLPQDVFSAAARCCSCHSHTDCFFFVLAYAYPYNAALPPYPPTLNSCSQTSRLTRSPFWLLCRDRGGGSKRKGRLVPGASACVESLLDLAVLLWFLLSFFGIRCKDAGAVVVLLPE